MQPHHVLVWLLIGLIAGALASRLVAGHGLGCLVDTLVGLAGAILGGAVLAALSPDRPANAAGILGDIAISFAGASLLLAVLRLLTRRGGGGQPPSAIRRW